MVGCCCKGAIPIGPILGGVVHVVVVEDVTAQEVGYLLDEALGEESEFGVWVSYCGGHDGNAVLDFYQLGIEVFPGEGWRSNRGAKEAESSSEFGGEGWAQDIYVIWFGRILGDGFVDGGG